MNRRTADAKQNLSNWDDLLSDTDALLSETKGLADEVRGSTDRIERAWEETSSDVEQTRTGVARTVDEQGADREAAAQFDAGDVAGSPASVPDAAPIHGDAALATDADYEIPDPASVEGARETVERTEERAPVAKECPVPFTEREWFELHSEQFPVGEELFPVDIRTRAEMSAADEQRADETVASQRDQEEER